MGLNWTIALPTYHGQQYLAETLASVLAQTDQNFELIVCDDGSNDDTLKIVAEMCGSRARIISNASGNPFGLAGNWNRCVEQSNGEWVTILHQDDLLKPDFIEFHRKVVGLNSDLGMLTGPAPLIDSLGNTVEVEIEQEFQWPEADLVVWPIHALSRVLVRSNPIRCPSTSIRRDLHLQSGGFDGRWKYVVDWDFWHRIGQLGAVGLTGKVLANQRWHASSETQKLAKGTIDLEENSRLMRAILAGEPFTESERPLIESEIRSRMTRAWFNRAYEAARRGDRKLEKIALSQAASENWRLLARLAATHPKAFVRMIYGRQSRA